MPTTIVTLRPSGVLGDESDLTFGTDSKLFGYASIPPDGSSVALGDFVLGDGTVDGVTFHARVSWNVLDQGPADPSLFVEWQVGPGSFVQSAPFLLPAGSFAEIVTTELTQRPGGGAWTEADVNALGMRARALCDDGGSQNSTDFSASDLWAAVRVTTPDPPPVGPPEPPDAFPLRHLVDAVVLPDPEVVPGVEMATAVAPLLLVETLLETVAMASALPPVVRREPEEVPS